MGCDGGRKNEQLLETGQMITRNGDNGVFTHLEMVQGEVFPFLLLLLLLLLLGVNRRVCGGWVSGLLLNVHHGRVPSVPYTYLFSCAGMVFMRRGCGSVLYVSWEWCR